MWKANPARWSWRRTSPRASRPRKKFAKVFQASPVAISIARLHDGHYIDVNEAFVRQFGWSREEILGRTSVEIGIWHCLADRERWIAELRKSGRLKSYEASIRIKSGEQRTALMYRGATQPGWGGMRSQ
ncbi:MAG: PAS domain-containing protein [Rhodocyclaceae bacterium]|nr:PAS domain-containing protein [Rhodocyclaceae bacterium]